MDALTVMIGTLVKRQLKCHKSGRNSRKNASVTAGLTLMEIGGPDLIPDCRKIVFVVVIIVVCHDEGECGIVWD